MQQFSIGKDGMGRFQTEGTVGTLIISFAERNITWLGEMFIWSMTGYVLGEPGSLRLEGYWFYHK